MISRSSNRTLRKIPERESRKQTMLGIEEVRHRLDFVKMYETNFFAISPVRSVLVEPTLRHECEYIMFIVRTLEKFSESRERYENAGLFKEFSPSRLTRRFAVLDTSAGELPPRIRVFFGLSDNNGPCGGIDHRDHPSEIKLQRGLHHVYHETPSVLLAVFIINHHI